MGPRIPDNKQVTAHDVRDMLRNEPIHPHRWRFLWVWIVAFSLVVIVGMTNIRHQSARADHLEETNCALKTFLYKARNARINASLSENGVLKTKDRQAARGYQIIADTITATGHCPLPKLPKLHG